MSVKTILSFGGNMRAFVLIMVFIVVQLLPLRESRSCTTAVISGKATPDGRPLLWKHRDSDTMQNALRYFTDGLYPYIGLINADDTCGSQIWAGYNAAGFAIMNSASYNLKAPADTTRLQDREGIIMKRALQICRTIDDFARLLDTLPKPLGVESNFGVIDAQGGAAYFETNNFSYKKLDANDPKIAPEGYIIHTNFSFTGRVNKGYGYIRYSEAQKLFGQAVAQNMLTPAFLLQKVSRSLEHGLTGMNLFRQAPGISDNPYVCFRDFIPRHSSVSVMVVQGVKKGEDVRQTVAWTILGFPLTSVAFPVWVSAGPDFPTFLKSNGKAYAPLCKAALRLKERCFPIKRGSGRNYLNIRALINKDGSGILQRILPFEEEILRLGNSQIRYFRKKGFDAQKVHSFYRTVGEKLQNFYRQEWQIDLTGETLEH